MSVPFTWLYKFHTMNINSLSALSNKKAWFSSISSLNDPFEGCFSVTRPETDDDFRMLFKPIANILLKKNMRDINTKELLSETGANDFIEKLYESGQPKFKEFMDNLLQEQEEDYRDEFLKMATYCLSSDIPGDERSHVANSLMWSHYADGLKGFCIKYNGQELHKSIKELNKEKNIDYAFVRYEKEMHKVFFLDFFDGNSKGFAGALHTKHDSWGYECEIRFLTNKNGYVNYSAESIDSIYIGDRMPPEQQKLLVDIVRKNYPDAKIHGVRFHKSSFSIEIGKWINE
ncbi:DUF2971 domain-containing protein [Buttiauxella noackiae]|uniref:DUF2971 domain-containing protein n=1 Tax=Buttiauxella noackiae TaxID=82992 RepID=UPI0005578FFF|nr:DUF2971 domain-containing protein [Buttiauxella noackiae]